MASSNWAIPQISQILPLDEQSLQQLLDYTYTLDKDAAAEHLKGVLGDSPKALDFINAFNARREPPSVSKTEPELSTAPRKARKKKAPLHSLPARKTEDHGNVAGAYQKKDNEDYMSASRKSSKQTPLANTLALSQRDQMLVNYPYQLLYLPDPRRSFPRRQQAHAYRTFPMYVLRHIRETHIVLGHLLQRPVSMSPVGPQCMGHPVPSKI